MTMSANTEARLQDFAQFPADYIHESRSGDWLPGLAGETASAIAANPRLRAKVSWLIARAYKLSEGSALLDEADALAVTASFETLERAATLAGASFHAPLIRRIVDREMLLEIFGVDGHGDYRFVISRAYDVPTSPAQQTTDGQGLARTVRKDGSACLNAWINALPASIAGRVRLKLPRSFVTPPLPQGAGPETARGLIRAALHHLNAARTLR